MESMNRCWASCVSPTQQVQPSVESDQGLWPLGQDTLPHYDLIVMKCRLRSYNVAPKKRKRSITVWGHKSHVMQKIPSKKELLGQKSGKKDLFERKAWHPKGFAQGKVSVGAAVHVFSLVVSKPKSPGRAQPQATGE